MFERRGSLFRKEALERLSSPERLDQLVEVVDRREWIASVALALLVAVAVVWSIVGRLPTTVTGRGVLIRPPDDQDKQPQGVVYFQLRDGQKIHPGMKVQVAPDTVQRERFGSIVGTVLTVSPVPVTKAGAARVIGNPEIAESLLSAGPRIEVVVDLERDASTVSGYRWSSSTGPPMRVSPGLTATARVTVEERAPLTYILPFLRSAVGVY